MDHLCYLCLVCVMLSRLSNTALWSPERADLLALVCDVYCDFVTFQFGIRGQVWYLIISIPDPCCLSYFDKTATTQMKCRLIIRVCTVC